MPGVVVDEVEVVLVLESPAAVETSTPGSIRAGTAQWHWGDTRGLPILQRSGNVVDVDQDEYYVPRGNDESMSMSEQPGV